MQITLAELRTQARNRADMSKSKFVSDSELNFYINNSIAELVDILTDAYGAEYYVKSINFNVVNGQADYPLPADFYILKGVDVKITGSDYVTIRPFNFNERNRYYENFIWTAGFDNIRYRLVGNNLSFTPIPNVAQEVRLWYVPIATRLVNDTDTLNDLNAYSEFVIVDAAIKMMQKEESDVSVLFAQKQALIDRIRAKAQSRDAASAPSVTDIYAEGDNYFWRFRT